MKVLALEASPHRGNTFRRVQVLGEALERYPGVTFEHLALRDFDLKPCRGCFTCFLHGEEKCPLGDRGMELLAKLDGADAVVFATPVYSMTVSWLMKLFVDRFAFAFHRPRFFGKYALGLAVTGGAGLKETLKYVKMFSSTWGFRYAGDLKFIDPPLGSTLPRLMPQKDRTEEMAEKLVEAVERREKWRPGFSELMNFHIMGSIYRRMGPYLPRDHGYWSEKGWFGREARYFDGAQGGGFLISLVPRFIGFAMGKFMDGRMKKLERGK